MVAVAPHDEVAALDRDDARIVGVFADAHVRVVPLQRDWRGVERPRDAVGAASEEERRHAVEAVAAEDAEEGALPRDDGAVVDRGDAGGGAVLRERIAVEAPQELGGAGGARLPGDGGEGFHEILARREESAGLQFVEALRGTGG